MADGYDNAEQSVDVRVTELEAIDPGAEDGLYWARFHRNVMQRASAELARRRELVQVTLADALSGWARMVVPAAAAAAALAGALLVQAPEPASQQALVEDALDMPSTLVEGPEPEVAPTFGALAVAENF